jgi:tetratricopeptide (TPR) repeat protein
MVRAVAIMESIADPDTYNEGLARALSMLGSVYVNLEKNDKARPLLERCLAMQERHLGRDHPDVAATLNDLAIILKAQGELAEAKAMYERGLAIDERMFGQDNVKCAATLSNLAGVFFDMGDFAQAKAFYLRSLAFAEQAYGCHNLSVATIVSNLAMRLKEEGALAEAKPLFERALVIYESQLGRTHPRTAVILSALADIATATGHNRTAQRLEARAEVAAVEAKQQPCGHCATPGVKYQKCSRCQQVYYCSVACQRSDWKVHKPRCHALPK